MKRASLAAAGVALLFLSLSACQQRPGVEGVPEEPLMVAAAASLREVAPALGEAWAKKNGKPAPAFTFGASGDLRKQVEGGAPVDGVVFASRAPVDALEKAKLLLTGTSTVVAGNQLVLIGRVEGPSLTFETLDQLGPEEMIAIGEPGAVPAGAYAREALQSLKKWDALQGRMAFGMDVSAVLAYARRGEVQAAIVYRTEATGIPDIRVLDEAPAGATTPVVVMSAAVTERGRDFNAFLASEEARALWHRFGFSTP